MRLGWTTYLKHAFQNWYNYIAMGLVVGLALILRQPGLVFIGAGLEIAYLYMCLSNPRFRRYVDSLVGEEKEVNVEPLRDYLWPHIETDLRESYTRLANLAGKLEGDSVTNLQKRDPFFKENRRKIAVLLANFLKIAFAVTRYNAYLADVNEPEIKENMERLEKEIPEANERVQQVKQKNVEILAKRLEKIDKAKANCSYLKAQMETIEDTMKLVVDQAITLADPKGTGMQIDNLLMNLQETELIANEMEQFNELEQGSLDDVVSLPEKE